MTTITLEEIANIKATINKARQNNRSDSVCYSVSVVGRILDALAALEGQCLAQS